MILRWLARRSATSRTGAAADDLRETRRAISDFLFVEDRRVAVDLAFVLGSPTYSSVEPAIALFRSGLAPHLLMSGNGPSGHTNQTSEAELYRDYAVARGVPTDAISIEPASSNTLENFQFSQRVIAETFGWQSIRTVSISGKPHHMRRALLTARATWPKHVRLVMLPSHHADDPLASNWWQTEGGRQLVFHELKAIGTYAGMGQIGIL